VLIINIMSITVLIVILILLVSGILYIIYSIKVAEIHDGLLDEEFDEKSFAKPSGWKVGVMPKEMQVTKKVELVKPASKNPEYGLDDIISKWRKEELSKFNKPE